MSRLPEPEQAAEPAARPVAWMAMRFAVPAQATTDEPTAIRWRKAGGDVRDLYASPPKREPLTDEQILACIRGVGLPRLMGLIRDHGPYEVTSPSHYAVQLVRQIERAHGIGVAP